MRWAEGSLQPWPLRAPENSPDRDAPLSQWRHARSRSGGSSPEHEELGRGEARLPGSREQRNGLDAAPGPSGLVDLVVFLDAGARNAGTVKWAASLAQEHRARLRGVLVEPAHVFSHAEMFARGPAMDDVIVSGEGRLERAEEEERERFIATVKRHGIGGEWRRARSYMAAEVALHARCADLVVVALEDGAQRGRDLDLPESLVLTCGRPVVILPPQGASGPLRRILVAWNAGAEVSRAVAGAMPLLCRADRVEVLVIDPEGGGPAHGQAPGADIAGHLARHGARVELRQLSSDTEDVGRLLLSRAAAFGADLVVMGAYGHSRLRERLFGGVTRTVLAEATLPVLMSR